MLIVIKDIIGSMKFHGKFIIYAIIGDEVEIKKWCDLTSIATNKRTGAKFPLSNKLIDEFVKDINKVKSIKELKPEQKVYSKPFEIDTSVFKVNIKQEIEKTKKAKQSSLW